jgi:DNA repair photolyase
MDITLTEARGILTPQRSGFLAGGPYPFTHALSAYTGCAFGNTTCGMYCYAQFLPNWAYHNPPLAWGEAIYVKTNAPELLERALVSMKPKARVKLRIFMSSTTDPYQPLESKQQITRRCLEIFARYPDLDLLVIQTRSPLAERDLELMNQIPYAWLSLTIETDDQTYLAKLKGGPSLEKRWALVQAARAANVPAQITVSPCLPYTNIEQFGQRLLHSGVRRIVIDTTIDGDGTGGARTARTSFAQAEPAWNATTPAHQLYDYLCEHAPSLGVALGWSNAGFCGIEPRRS